MRQKCSAYQLSWQEECRWPCCCSCTGGWKGSMGNEQHSKIAIREGMIFWIQFYSLTQFTAYRQWCRCNQADKNTGYWGRFLVSLLPSRGVLTTDGARICWVQAWDLRHAIGWKQHFYFPKESRQRELTGAITAFSPVHSHCWYLHVDNGHQPQAPTSCAKRWQHHNRT